MTQKTHHFGEKDALAHVVERRAEGILSLAESHGTEMAGHFAAFADTLREGGLLFALLWIFAVSFDLPWPFFLAFAAGWFFWKTGRSAWLGWARLERLHTVIEQEKYEIEHHKDQEREELIVLYRAKGFSGKLLDEVVDVLMSDQDRLLKVMLEEELGLVLEAHEHPLKQAFGAAIGALLSGVLALVAYLLFPSFGILVVSSLLLIGGSLLSALKEKNRIIAAMIWNLGIAALAFGTTFFLLNLFL